MPKMDTSLASVVDVYDIASEIGKEFEKLIDAHGAEAVTSLMPKVITALEQLERLAMRNEREDTAVQELRARVAQLEADKLEKAEDRQRFEKELEQIEDHWRQESRELLSLVARLQEENRRLAGQLRDGDDAFSTRTAASPLSPEVDLNVMQRLREAAEGLREQLRAKDRELGTRSSDIESLQSQLDRNTAQGRELRRKQRGYQAQVRALLDERADCQAQLQEQQRELMNLRQRLGLAQKENEDLLQAEEEDRPRFTTTELRDILRERNELKARVSDLEEELHTFRSASPTPATESESSEDAPVQGPLPYEPDDAPWKRTGSESGIRKFFRKLFGESSTGFSLGGSAGPSPKRSLSALSKLALAGSSGNNSASGLDTCV